MSPDEEKIADYCSSSGSELSRVMRQGVIEALLEHKRLGNPVVVWDCVSRQIVTLGPDEISIPEIESEATEANSARHGD